MPRPGTESRPGGGLDAFQNFLLWVTCPMTENLSPPHDDDYRSIFENAVVGIFRKTHQGKFVSLNPAMARIFGYESPEAMLKGIKDIGHKVFVDPESPQELLAKLRAEGRVSLFEFRVFRKDRSIIWISANGRAVCGEDGEIKYYEGTLVDITERKRAEEERARLAAAVGQVAENVLITDTDFRIEYVNAAFERDTGYGLEEVAGRHVSLLSARNRGSGFFEDIRRQVLGGEVWSGGISTKGKDDKVRESKIMVSPLRDEGGRVVNLVLVSRDVTRQVQLEKQLLQAQKMEAIGTLAGGIAHDFNNILMPVMVHAQMALRDMAEDDPRAWRLDRVLKAVKRAKGLVRQILDFGRRGSGEKRAYNLSPIIKETLHFVRATLPSTIDIQRDISPENDMAMVDPTQVHQILVNLCSNSGYAMRQTGGELNVGLHNVAVNGKEPDQELTGEPGLPPGLGYGDYVVLTVEDSGAGMSPETMERIYDPFFTTKGSHEGTGMGLSVVHGIVTGYGGGITVESERGRGTVFRVYLPCIEALPGHVEEAISLPPRLGYERILVVDDEPDIVEAWKDVLKNQGYKVFAHQNSVEALKEFVESPDSFDLVITDQTMPQMTGEELARTILGIRPDLPVVLCTGYTEAVSPEQMKLSGIDRVAFKPLDVEDMNRIVGEMLGPQAGNGGDLGQSADN